MGDYVERDKVIREMEWYIERFPDCAECLEARKSIIAHIPSADVLPRDEAIKMGAELAAMHGSDATSQQLEEAYLKGVEYGMTRRDVRPVVRGKWIMNDECRTVCSLCGNVVAFVSHPDRRWDFGNYCPKCGADMR